MDLGCPDASAREVRHRFILNDGERHLYLPQTVEVNDKRNIGSYFSNSKLDWHYCLVIGISNTFLSDNIYTFFFGHVW